MLWRWGGGEEIGRSWYGVVATEEVLIVQR